MSNYSAPWARIWRLRPWYGSPLLRGSDRFETAVWLCAVVVALIAVPLAGAVGTASYSAAALRIQSDNSTKVAVPAVVSARPAVVVTGDHPTATDRYQAAVRWERDGRAHTATITVPESAQPGDTVDVWVGPDGGPAAPPLDSTAAASSGVSAGIGLLIGIWSVIWGLVWLLRRLLTRRRHATWEREWRSMSGPVGRDGNDVQLQ